MSKVILNTALSEISNFKDKLGENFYDAIVEDDNSTYEMGKSIVSVFSECDTERDFHIADAMLIATCGYSIQTLVERIKELDAMGHQWESC